MTDAVIIGVGQRVSTEKRGRRRVWRTELWWVTGVWWDGDRVKSVSLSPRREKAVEVRKSTAISIAKFYRGVSVVTR